MGNYKDESRKDWQPNPAGRQVTNDEIMLGCLQRLADAAERQATVAEQHLKLATATNTRTHQLEALVKENDRKITSLKGSISKLRKELKGE
ncbi:hypothetical protein GCM10023185_07150 [Hymenobacter saemangeumensis]|uniref:Uncharacterized protein n=1 Tax=Hymenobacter saemangeumensis TaxID=1084522 RepID=A0ABP8I2G1_9BACT